MKMICKILLALAFNLVCAVAPAQELEVRDSIIYRDSLVIRESLRVAEDLEGYSIFDNIPEGVTVRHSAAIGAAIDNQILKNGQTLSDGYRIRIYFDNSRTSREESALEEERFHRMYPQYRTYRSFKNPFFKVTVGDFRTKSDAQIALSDIVRQFPSSFIVREKIKFPIIDLSCPLRVDTLKVPVDTLYIELAE